MTLEEQIKHYRKTGWTFSQEKMAGENRCIKTSHYKVGKWNRNTGYCNLMAIADLFQISVDELLNEK